MQLVRTIVREADELFLNCRTEHVAVIDDRIGRDLIRELWVKVGRIDRRSDARFERWSNLLGQQLSPIDVFAEERVRLDALCTRMARPESLCRIAVEEQRQKRACIRLDFIAKAQWVLQDLAIHLVDVLRVEWWQPSQHLVEQHTEGPPIDGFGIALSQEQFGCQVLGRSTECCAQVVSLSANRRKGATGSASTHCSSFLQRPCSTCTVRNLTRQCGQYNQARYSPASNRDK